MVTTMQFTVAFTPKHIHFTNQQDVVRRATALAEEKKVLLLASESFLQRQQLQSLAAAVCKQGGFHWGRIQQNPSAVFVAQVLQALQSVQFDVILAMGGGSCIDLAKAVSALHPLPQGVGSPWVVQAVLQNSYTSNSIYTPIVAVPTTAGTGSEATQWATIWDVENSKKLSLDTPALTPAEAWIAPEFTQSAPAPLALSTGLDALSHAMEACWAKARSPISQLLGFKAVGIIANALPAVVAGQAAPARYEEMAYASLLAGLAFATTRTAAAHSISYPLTLLYGIPHGFAVALALGGVLQYNREAVPELEQLQPVFAPHGGFKNWLHQLCAPVQPLCLSAFGVPRAAIPQIAAAAFTPGRMDNNPCPLTQKQVQGILQSVYEEGP